MEKGEHCEDMPDAMTLFTFFPQFLSLGRSHFLQSAAKGLGTAIAGNSSRLSPSCDCWCPLLPRDRCCTPGLCPQVGVWITPRNKHCCMEKDFVGGSPPFGQHQLPSKCHHSLFLITLSPREIWSHIQHLSFNFQDPQRTWQGRPRQCLPHGSDVLEQLLSPDTMKMSLLRLMVEVRGRGGPLWLSRYPRSQVGRLERLGPRDAWHSMDPLAHRRSSLWEGAWQRQTWKEEWCREFKKKEGNLNICERWVSHVATLEDGYLHFMLLHCILIFTKASVFQKC